MQVRGIEVPEISGSEARKQIAAIDRQIDAVRRELTKRVGRIKNPLSASCWQDAWDKHPVLRSEETALFKQRGVLQLARDTSDYRAALRLGTPKGPRPRKCPSCGVASVEAARKLKRNELKATAT